MRKRRAVQLAILLPALLLLAGSTAWAQKTVGEVRGTVADTSGAILPGVAVTLTNVNTGFARTVTTDTKGDFVFPVVDPGRYRVDSALQGFKKDSREVSVSALGVAQVQIQLAVGNLEEAVEVTVAVEGVNVTSGGTAHTLQKEVLEIPNLNRYGFANAVLMPAIQQVEERKETINASVAGNVSNRNAFYIDGAEATDPWRGWSPRQPMVDAFEEIVVNTAGATVDVGSNFGGTYNAIFKSGTNQFHGSAWYFFRDSSLNANSWSNNRVGLKRPEDPLKYWGGQVGGPIIKDKLFFYVTGGRETDETPFSQTGLFAPTSAMLNGDFSGLGLGSDFAIYDPLTGQPFPGNVIPASRIDATSKAFWDTYGYSIPSYGPNYSFQFANTRKVTNINGRIDYNINQEHRLTLSGYWFKNETISPDARVQSISGGPTGGTSGNTFQKGGNELSEFPQTVLNGKWTFTPRSNLVIEARAAWSEMPERVVLAEDSLGTTFGTLGANDPLPRPDAPEILPAINIGGWWGDPEGAILFNGWTTDFTVKNLTLGSSATWIKGSHSVKVGAEFQDGSFNTIKPPGYGGGNTMSFNGNATSKNNPTQGGRGARFAHAMADFLLGRFDSYNQSDGFDVTLQSWNLGVYAMDTWRVTPRLTITPGIRLEYNSGISEIENRLTLYRPGLQSTKYPNYPPGVVVAGDAGIPDTISGSFTRIAPRINLAYDVFGDGKTAVRGSIGQYYGRDVMALYETHYLRKPPYTGASANARGGQFSNPWLTSTNPVYTSVPLPFTDQDPAAFKWPTQVSGLREQDEDYGLGSSWQWNLAVEREIFDGVRLEASYQGNSSTTTPTLLPTNLAVWADGATDSSSNIQARRPNQFLGDNGGILINDGRTRFDQFLIIARARKSSLFAQVSWAYTHARRNFAGDSNVQGNRDWDTGINNAVYPDILFDFQNNQTIQGFVVWDLPIFKDKSTTAGKILGGWQITADGYWNFDNKGRNVSAGYDANADGFGGDLAAVVGNISYPKTEITGQGDLLYQWLDPGAFAYPNGSTVRSFSPTTTDAGAMVIDQLPWAWGVNMGLLKTFRIAGDARVQLRFESFNVFNHANLNGPNLSVSSSDFGKIRGKYGQGRRIQMGVRFIF